MHVCVRVLCVCVHACACACACVCVHVCGYINDAQRVVRVDGTKVVMTQ